VLFVRAVVINERGEAVCSNAVAAPVAAAGEVIVRPTYMLVSTPDRELVRSRGAAVAAAGQVLGHQFVGVVEEASQGGAYGAKLLGKRVVGSITVACGVCDLCKGGLSHHCRVRTVVGLRGRSGCFAEKLAIPAANLLAVPEGVEDARAVFAYAISSAAHVSAAFRVEGKPYISVLGDGLMGLLSVQVMARLNARVRLLGKHEKKLLMCERWGIKHRLVGEVGRRLDQDVIVDCTGSATGLVDALGMVRPRGKVVLKRGPVDVGASAKESAGWLGGLVEREVELIGSRCGSLSEGLALLKDRLVQVEGLVARTVGLEDVPGVLMRERGEGGEVAVRT
jgi:threonine dehydrogenase-like Zn-dependent dehydrogenase